MTGVQTCALPISKVQGSVSTQLEGKANVLESEIKMDQGRGVSTKKKEEELADIQSKAQETKTSQISTLANANKVMEEAAKKEETTQTAESNKNETDKTTAAGNKEQTDEVTQYTASGVNNKETVSATKQPVTVEVVGVEAAQTSTQTTPYTSIDVRL